MTKNQSPRRICAVLLDARLPGARVLVQASCCERADPARAKQGFAGRLLLHPCSTRARYERLQQSTWPPSGHLLMPHRQDEHELS